MKRSTRLFIRAATFLIAAAVSIVLWKQGGYSTNLSNPSIATTTFSASLDDLSDQLVSDFEDEVGILQNVADTDNSSGATTGETGGNRNDREVHTNATVTHVVDGDTLDADLDGTGEVRIRLLGVNTPETVDPRKPVECFGKAASDFSKRMMKEGDRIRVEEDPQADERDKYGRLLRNIMLADGTDYNALLIQDGYAHAYLSFPLDPARKVQLKKLENEAKAAEKGLWGADCR
jgi:micrococcal nuclease